jgi:hypothetical protein
MPNFGKVFCFRRFDVNSLKLSEVLVFGMGFHGVASVRGQKTRTKKGRNSLTVFNFFVRQL